MKKLFSFLLKAIGVFLLIAGLLTAWMIYDTQQYKAFHSAEHVPDLAHYLTYYGNPDKMYLMRANQTHYYGLIPPKRDVRVFISGPPIFLYDQYGILWDHTWNSGDVDFEKGNQVGDVKWDKEIENPMQVIQKVIGAHAE